MKRIILFITAISLSLNLFAKYDLDETIPNDPRVVKGTLDNGITYYIKENKRPKGRAEIQLLVHAGSNQEDNKQLGLAHFIEHMAFNGTKNFPKNELVKYLESTGMSFGGDINASTSNERVYYTLQVPTDDEKMLSDGFQVLRDWLTDVNFDSQQIDDERNVIVEEWRLRTRTAQGKFIEKLFSNLYKGSKYADMTIGDTNIIMTAPKEDFVRYYNDFYRPEIAAVICVGDFNKDNILKQIKEKFESVPKSKNPISVQSLPIPEWQGTDVIFEENPELPGTETLIFFDMRGGLKEGTYGAYRDNLVQGMIPSMFGQRVRELVTKDKIAAQGGLFSRVDYPGEIKPVFINITHKEGKLKEGYEDVLKEVYRVKQHGFTQNELDRAKQSILSSIESMAKDEENMQSGMFAAELSRNFMENEAYAGIQEDYNITKYFLEDITLEDVNNTAKEFLKNYPAKIFHVGPKDLLDQNTLTETLSSVQKMKLEPWVEEKVAESLLATTPKPGKIVNADNYSFGDESKPYGKYEVTSYTLSNGAEVKLVKTDLKEDEVRFYARSSGGNLLIDDINKYYGASLASSITAQSGVGEHDITALQKILNGKRVRVSPSISDLTENLNGFCSPDDMEEMFQLIHLYFTNPRYDDVAVKSFVERTKENVKNSSNNPQSVFYDSISAFVYKNHPRQFNWTEEMINQIDTKQSFEWYKERFSDASDFTFYFVGNFDEAKINENIQTYLASLPSKNRNEKWVDRDVRRTKESFKKVINVGTEPNATVRLMMNNDYDYSSTNNMYLTAVARALNILLTEKIREEMGGVYSVSAWSSQNHYPVAEYEVNVQFGCDPQRVDELVEAVVGQIKYLQDNKLDDDYMSRVTEVIKSQYKKAFESNNFWLNYVSSVDWHGSDPNRIIDLEKQIETLSAEDIQMAAKKYFDLKTLKQMIRKPKV